jgi:hypothetical protein
MRVRIMDLFSHVLEIVHDTSGIHSAIAPNEEAADQQAYDVR